MKKITFFTVLILMSSTFIVLLISAGLLLNITDSLLNAGQSGGLAEVFISGLAQMRTIGGVGIGLALILLTASAVFFLRGARRSLRKESTFIEAVSTGKASIPEKLPFASGNDVSRISTALLRLFTELRRFILQIKNTGIQSQEMGEDLLKQAKTIGEQTETIKSTMGNVETKVQELDKEVVESETAVREMNQYIDNVNEQISEQSSAVSESSASVEELIASIKNIAAIAESKEQQAQSLAKSAKTSDGEMRKTSEVIRKVSESTSVVMEMVEVINDIAENTDLLAMNAAIEAAHAGSYGHGFAVVAQEIRSLAENARNNARKMNENLKQVVENVQSMADISGGLEESNRKMIQEIHEVADGMREMRNGTEEMSAGSDQISSALGNLVSSSDQLQEASTGMKSRLEVVEHSVGALKDLSRMNTESAQAVGVTVERIGRSIHMLEKLGQVNERTVGTLNHYVARFPVRGNVVAENLPPYNYLQNGEPMGLAVDIVRAMHMQMNRTAEIEFMRWEEAQETASNHPEVLLLTVFRSEERESMFHWIGPAFQEQVHLFSLTQREIGAVSDIAARRDLRIGTQRGNLETKYLLEKGFETDKNLFIYNDTSQLIQALYSQNVDVIPMGKLQMVHQLQVMQRDPTDLESIFALKEMSTDLYMTVSRSTSEKSVRMYRDAFRQLRDTKEYDRILDRWT